MQRRSLGLIVNIGIMGLNQNTLRTYFSNLMGNQQMNDESVFGGTPIYAKSIDTQECSAGGSFLILPPSITFSKQTG
ncbi:MAG: hypothetical protein EZS28_028784 [Streblomastix strix]|uniref:Uncharacterized protein n=1 Tax=Streblomastix strix TaxID=222440 RepID=A0A5J4UZB7_9EUKA|nr:MAG: hypothetical protein EZS28_028784 [Streblomastix strix]